MCVWLLAVISEHSKAHPSKTMHLGLSIYVETYLIFTAILGDPEAGTSQCFQGLAKTFIIIRKRDH